MNEQEVCPGCGRHCELSAPGCGRGRVFAQTGVLPERGKCEGHHHGMHCKGSDINDKLIINLRDISHMMRMQYEGKASQKRILIVINLSDPMTQRELTERLGVQPGTVSEILAKMENAGLITRTQNDTDRRTADVVLTEEGRRLAIETAEQRKKRHEDMFSCLAPEEKEKLLSVLERIRADWEVRFVGGPGEGHHGHHGEHGEHECHGERPHGGHPHHGE